MAVQIDAAKSVDTLVCDSKTLKDFIDETSSGAARYGLLPTASTLPK